MITAACQINQHKYVHLSRYLNESHSFPLPLFKGLAKYRYEVCNTGGISKVCSICHLLQLSSLLIGLSLLFSLFFKTSCTLHPPVGFCCVHCSTFSISISVVSFSHYTYHYRNTNQLHIIISNIR